MSAVGPIATEIYVRWHVGDYGKSGLVMLSASFVARDPNATSTRPGPSHPAYGGHFDLAPPHPCRIRLRYLVEDRHGHFGGRAWRGER